MKKLFTILFVFYAIQLIAQTNYFISWQSANHQVYNIQQSTDNSTWKTIGTQSGILTQNTYTYELPSLNFWYRITADKVVSDSRFAAEVLSVDITDWGILPSYGYVTIYFTSHNEMSVSGYEIDRSYDAVTFTPVITVPAKGDSKYSIFVIRPVITTTRGFWFWKRTITKIDSRKGIYQIKEVHKDGSKHLLKTLSE